MNKILLLGFITSISLMVHASVEPLPDDSKKSPAKTITNNVKKKDIGIYKMFAWRYPKYFNLYVDGKKLKPGQSIEMPAYKKNVDLEYDYEWYTPWGNKTGRKKTKFKLSEKKQDHAVSFSGWKTNNRIHLSHSQKLTVEQEAE